MQALYHISETQNITLTRRLNRPNGNRESQEQERTETASYLQIIAKIRLDKLTIIYQIVKIKSQRFDGQREKLFRKPLDKRAILLYLCPRKLIKPYGIIR